MREKLGAKISRRDADADSSARRLEDLKLQLDEARVQLTGAGAAAEEARREVRGCAGELAGGRQGL